MAASKRIGVSYGPAGRKTVFDLPADTMLRVTVAGREYLMMAAGLDRKDGGGLYIQASAITGKHLMRKLLVEPQSGNAIIVRGE